MCKTVRRGYVSSDEKEFNKEALVKLYSARNDLFYLLNNGYKIKNASIFVGNHYLLSERQRIALTRGVSSENSINKRKEKEIKSSLEGRIINIDGFNTIITLEVALSNSILLKCMDGTIRDLAGLRGTYKLIDKTDIAINIIGKKLEKEKVAKVNFYLDAPVSNSGRLKMRILDILSKFSFHVEVNIINNVDTTLELLDNVVSSDGIILDKCKGWINLNSKLIKEYIKDYPYIDFTNKIRHL